jgi:hypothetical protein
MVFLFSAGLSELVIKMGSVRRNPHKFPEFPRSMTNILSLLEFCFLGKRVSLRPNKLFHGAMKNEGSPWLRGARELR